MACMSGNIVIVQTLFDNGAGINTSDVNGICYLYNGLLCIVPFYGSILML